jgi:site-specific recombinase XerD
VLRAPTYRPSSHGAYRLTAARELPLASFRQFFRYLVGEAVIDEDPTALIAVSGWASGAQYLIGRKLATPAHRRDYG